MAAPDDTLSKIDHSMETSMHRCRDRASWYLHLTSLSQRPKVASEEYYSI